MLKSLMNGTALRGSMAFAADAANAQGMNTNLTHVVAQNPDNVFAFICKTLEAVHKSSTSLCVSIAQLFIVRTFHGDDAQRWPAVKTRDWLKAQLNERGLRQAMSYKYIQTGQEIARLIQKKYVWGGLMHEVLAAETEMKAYNAILRCVMAHEFLAAGQKPALEWLLDADSKPRFSLDVLRVNLGLDKLMPKVPVTAAPQPGSNTTETPTIASVPATKASPASMVARLKADPEALAGIDSGTLAGAIEKVIGREPMAERLISLCSLAECIKLQTVLNDRIAALADVKPEVEAAPTDAPVETKEETVIEPTTTGRRGRNKSRKAA